MSQDAFQQRMDAILEKCPSCTSIADDVAVYGSTEEEHDDNLMKVAQENGLVFNLGKCLIKTNEIPFFGLMYTADGVKPNPDRVDGIRALPTPQEHAGASRIPQHCHVYGIIRAVSVTSLCNPARTPQA